MSNGNRSYDTHMTKPKGIFVIYHCHSFPSTKGERVTAKGHSNTLNNQLIEKEGRRSTEREKTRSISMDWSLRVYNDPRISVENMYCKLIAMFWLFIWSLHSIFRVFSVMVSCSCLVTMNVCYLRF